MPLEEKLIELFNLFPRQSAYYDDLLDSIHIPLEKGLKVSVFNEHGVYWVEAYLTGFGTLKKHCDVNSDTGFKWVYSLSFSPGESTNHANELGPLKKDECEEICKKALPFLASFGMDKKLIPLLINDYPEFANRALEYIP